jgi:hypothetical protein
MMEKLRRVIINNLWFIVMVLAFCMLLTHSFDNKIVTVDTNSVILLAFILASPLIAALKRIKFGGFEAEIDPQEVAAVKELAESSIPIAKQTTNHRARTEETTSAIRTLSEKDTVLALAKLRIEFESRLRQLYNAKFPDSKKDFAPLYQMLKVLVNNDILEQEFSNSLRRVFSIANRALHGEDIRDIDADTIITIGIDLLEYLDSIVFERTSTQPKESVKISDEKLAEYKFARYKLITMIPYVESPIMNTYILSQTELDNFLSHYPEYAEFLISLEKVS